MGKCGRVLVLLLVSIFSPSSLSTASRRSDLKLISYRYGYDVRVFEVFIWN